MVDSNKYNDVSNVTIQGINGCGDKITWRWKALRTIQDICELSVPSTITKSEALFIYKVVAEYKPRYIVETGSGKTSLAFLVALRDNGFGRLYSIDLPELIATREYIENKGVIKRLWQDIVREYPEWTIYEMRIEEKLPALLAGLPQVDLFFHDSLHTTEHIRYEWETLLNSKKWGSGGLFGIHDRGHEQYVQFVQNLREDQTLQSVGFVQQAEFWKKV